MRRLALTTAAAAVLAAMAAPAWAVPVQWTIAGTFDDGGSVSGTFVYDYDTNTYSAVNVTTTAGATLPGAVYTTQAIYGGSNAFALVTATGANPGEPLLTVTITGSMNNAGGLRNIAGDQEAICDGPSCAFVSLSPRVFTSGTLTGVVLPPPTPTVPTMGEWAMIGLATLLAGLGGLMVMGRRRLV